MYMQGMLYNQTDYSYFPQCLFQANIHCKYCNAKSLAVHAFYMYVVFTIKIIYGVTQAFELCKSIGPCLPHTCDTLVMTDRAV